MLQNTYKAASLMAHQNAMIRLEHHIARNSNCCGYAAKKEKDNKSNCHVPVTDTVSMCAKYVDITVPT